MCDSLPSYKVRKAQGKPYIDKRRSNSELDENITISKQLFTLA